MNRSEKILDHLETALTVAREDLARTGGVSVRSIENDIRALNATLAPAARIVLEDQARYRLVVLDPERYARSARGARRRESFNDTARRQAYIFETLLIQDAPVSVEALAEDMKVGRSTAAADLAKLRSVLDAYLIRLRARTHVGYWLEGEELPIRHVLLDVFFDDIYTHGQPAWQRERVDAVAARHQFDGDTADRLARWHAVMVDRVRSGHAVTELPSSYEALIGTAAHRCAAELLLASKPHLPSDVPDAEALFLALPLAAMRTPLQESDAPSTLSADDQLLVDSIMARIRAEMGLTLAMEDLDLLEKFVQHIAFLLNRMRYHVRLGTDVPGIRDSYPVAFRMAEIAKDVIESEHGGDVIDDELDFIAAYFEVFLHEQHKRTPKRTRVAVVAVPGTVSTSLLRMRLAELVSDDVELVVLAPASVDERSLSGFDVVVAPPGAEIETTLPILRLRADFDQQEFVNWVRRARAHAYWGARLTGLDHLVAGLAIPEQFYVLEPQDTYEQLLASLMDAMVARGEISGHVRERVEQREKTRAMRLDEHLGFPHLSDPSIDELTFAVGVARRDPHETGVRIVFLLLLPEDSGGYDDLLVQLYDEIIRLAADKDFLDRVSASTSFHEYLLHFLKGPTS